MSAPAPKYVNHDGHRWHVLRTVDEGEDGIMLELSRLVGRIGGHRRPRVIWAKAGECQAWQRPQVRRIRTTARLRGRRVVFEFDERTEVVTLRLERGRGGLTSTLGGLYDTLARQKAANVKRDRKFNRRTR
jgi:hypothetical protein